MEKTNMDQHILRVSGFHRESIVDGYGLRYVVFTQGCPHNCPGCHNPATHDFGGGYDADTNDIFQEICENPLLDGVTFSGGEPFCQTAPLLALARKITGAGLNLTIYTGYTLETLLARKDTDTRALLALTDLLIDGPFLLAERDLELKFRGSRNQRLLDGKASLAAGKAVFYQR